MKRAVVLASLFVGCGFSGNSATDTSDDVPTDDTPTDDTPADDTPTDDVPPDDGDMVMFDAPVPDAPIDAAIDAAIDAPPPEFCIGTGLGRVCLDAQPTGTRPLENATIDTSNAANCTSLEMVDGVEACVIAADIITNLPGALFRAVGSRPLVIAAVTAITINGDLAVSSRRTAGYVGAGASMAACDSGAGGPHPAGGGGGAGGSFQGRGGNGGVGNSSAGMGQGAAGMSAQNNPTPRFRAGCKGGNGGASSGTTDNAGWGGGAIFLVSNGTIGLGIDASIGAGGMGGGGPSPGRGGGGGGSGGFIGLDAASVNLSGALIAAGGGGGEGGGDNADGEAGSDGTSGGGARGGNDVSLGGAGGDGSSPTSGAQNGGDSGTYGGGGGGGGAGFIYIHAATQNISVVANPVPTVL